MPTPELSLPTPEELFHLLKLCGSEQQVVAYLAKKFCVSPGSIAETVHGWLANLPTVPPPSRQRSAPAIPLNGIKFRSLTSSSSLSTAVSFQTRPEMLTVKTPPASAPVRPASREMMKTLERLNHRINHSTLAASSTLYHRTPLGDVQQVVMDHRNKFATTLCPPSVPEHAPVTDEEQAIRKYLERSMTRLSHAQPGGARMRF